MTEAEAKTKPCIGPCPFNTGMPANSNEQGIIVYVCAGSACLAWRWMTRGTLETKDSRRTQSVNAAGELVVTITNGVEMGGYCGLAGTP